MILGLFVPTFQTDYDKVSASIWIRVYQMVKHYEALGVKVYINNPFIIYDVCIYYRLSSRLSINIIKYLKLISKKVYWDTCVNYYDLHSNTTLKQVEATKKISSLVDGIITSTDEIANKAIIYNDNVFVMDDPIDFEHFKFKKYNIDFDNPIFGWSGLSDKAIFINKYKEYINSMLIISEKKPLLDMEYIFYKWKYQSFPFLLTKVDIAFLPREYKNNPYNMGHSSFKALVFASQGIPIIANKLPSYEKMVKYYNGIVFLEDYTSLEEAINHLKTKDLSVINIQTYFSCENQSFRLLKFLELIK
jgi:hypothetical protein